jgi:hypothetical protein
MILEYRVTVLTRILIFFCQNKEGVEARERVRNAPQQT